MSHQLVQPPSAAVCLLSPDMEVQFQGPNQDMPIQYIPVLESSSKDNKLRPTKFTPHEDLGTIVYR